MKIDVIEVWQDENTKEVCEALSTLQLKDVMRILDYTQRSKALWGYRKETVFVFFYGGVDTVIQANYSSFNKLWTAYLGNQPLFKFN